MNTENNKLIAEFMEWYYKGMNTYLTPYSDAWSTNGEQTYSCPLNVMRFHSDWNWLMEVVEKIESLGFGTSIVGGKNGFACVVTNGIENSFVGNHKINSTKIQAVYNACVEFIKWYNKQNKTNKIMKKVLVKTFFEWVFSDENSQGVSISKESIDHMNQFTFNHLKQLLLDVGVLPYHCIYNWEEEDLEGDFNTEDLELVKSVENIY